MVVKRHPEAPSFVICNLSLKLPEFREFVNKNKSGDWMNIDVKMSKGGKFYAELNTYKADKEKKAEFTPEEIEMMQKMREGKVASNDPIQYPHDEITPDDIPF